MNRMCAVVLAALTCTGAYAAPRNPAATRGDCGQLAAAVLPHTTVVSAQMIPPGSYAPPGSGQTYDSLPAFCRVVGISTPTPNSKIGFEVWLPVGARYNGRYQQVGNGGFAGAIHYKLLAEALRRGFAAASTDNGHQVQQDPSFAWGAPDRIVDFGWRAVKETTDRAKALIGAFYGTPPKFSYFVGCSEGGREALIVAQRFPRDFDGIIAGAPANHWTKQFAALVWGVQASRDRSSRAPLLSPVDLRILSAAVRAQCAGKDGGLPGDKFLTNPPLCKIDWSKIACAPSQDSTTCLSATKVAAVKALYAGPSHPLTGAPLYPGYEPGTEDYPGAWQPWITGPSGVEPYASFGHNAFYGEGYFANFVFGVPHYDLMTFDFDRDLTRGESLAPILDAADPDLAPFRAHGGKLIQYIGWADPGVPPRDSVAYYEEVRRAMGLTQAEQQKFYRLFMVPGMCHCSGGPGPNAFGNSIELPPPMDADHDILMALQRWRETGAAPRAIIATKYAGDTLSGGIEAQRPVCAYPLVGQYLGKPRDPNKAASFRCAPAERSGRR